MKAMLHAFPAFPLNNVLDFAVACQNDYIFSHKSVKCYMLNMNKVFFSSLKYQKMCSFTLISYHVNKYAMITLYNSRACSFIDVVEI